MFKVLNKLYLSRKDLETEENRIKINHDSESYEGDVICRNKELVTVVKFENDTYGVLVYIDSWARDKNFKFVIFKDFNEIANNFIHDLSRCVFNTVGVINTIESYFEDILDMYKHVEVSKSSIPSAPNTETMRAIVQGDLNIKKDYPHYSSYGMTKYVYIGFTIGSGILDESKEQLTAVLTLCSKLAAKKIKNASDLNSHGTAYNTVGIHN